MPKNRSLVLFRALANETRLEILGLLARCESAGLRSGDIARELGISPASASHHLFILNKMNFVERCPNAIGRTFQIRDEAIAQMIDSTLRVFNLPGDDPDGDSA